MQARFQENLIAGALWKINDILTFRTTQSQFLSLLLQKLCVLLICTYLASGFSLGPETSEFIEGSCRYPVTATHILFLVRYLYMILKDNELLLFMMPNFTLKCFGFVPIK